MALLLLVALTIIIITILIKRRYKYWTSRGVYQINPTYLLGNYGPILQGKSSYADKIIEWYSELKKRNLKYGGIYMLVQPSFIPMDPEVIKQIMVTDFSSFASHGGTTPEGVDPLNDDLFALSGHKWRDLRVKLSPTFTSGKMKFMFNIMQACSAGLADMLKEYSVEMKPAELKDILGRFTTDVIGNCAFGLECNSMKDPDNEFRIRGKEALHMSGIEALKVLFIMNLPQSIIKLFRLKLTKPSTEKFFFKIVKDTVRYREDNNVKRNDFMQLLLQLKNKGKLTEDGDFQLKEGDKTHLNMNEITAQVFLFFVAGFETSATTMTFALLELSQNIDIQDKLRSEINDILQKYDNNVTYEAIQDMKYLDQVISETLRKHSAVVAIPRECTKDCKIIGTDLVIKKGTRIEIPVLGLHSDPEYFENPDKFDPGRFSNENKSKIRPFTYLPFGEGPRICIGLRFGVLQAKIGLVSVLRKYKVTLNEKTKMPIEFDPESFLIGSIKGGMWVNVTDVTSS